MVNILLEDKLAAWENSYKNKALDYYKCKDYYNLKTIVDEELSKAIKKSDLYNSEEYDDQVRVLKDLKLSVDTHYYHSLDLDEYDCDEDLDDNTLEYD